MLKSKSNSTGVFMYKYFWYKFQKIKYVNNLSALVNVIKTKHELKNTKCIISMAIQKTKYPYVILKYKWDILSIFVDCYT